MIVWWWLAACTQETEVELTGVVWDGPGETSLPLAGVDLTFLDLDGNELATSTSNDEGRFETSIRGGDAVFAVLRRDGYATSTFPGVIGLEEEQIVEDHTLYAVSEAIADQLFIDFEGCPGADGPRRATFGEVRVYGLADPLTGGSPTVATAIARVWGGPDLDQKQDACYRNAFGEGYEPRAEETGNSGSFAVFDLDPGLHEIEVQFEAVPDLTSSQSYPVWIPEDPLVLAPWFPLWVEFPF